MKAINLPIAGGITSSATLRQIMADVLNVPVMVSEHPEASARGAAAAAAVACSVYANLEESVAEQCDHPVIYAPSPSIAAEYVSHYERWLDIGGQLGQAKAETLEA